MFGEIQLKALYPLGTLALIVSQFHAPPFGESETCYTIDCTVDRIGERIPLVVDNEANVIGLERT
jgi:hypothetical protein